MNSELACQVDTAYSTTDISDESFSEPFYDSNNADAASDCRVDFFDMLGESWLLVSFVLVPILYPKSRLSHGC